MSREIKFRAWWKSQKLMEYNVQNWNNIGEHLALLIPKESFDELLRSDNFVVMQYTGLCDKNGNEIWEGDIVNVSWKDSWKTESEEHVGTVSFIDDYAGFMIDIQDIDAFKYFGAYYPDQLEVIGNIYENPELLEGGDDGRKRSIR